MDRKKKRRVLMPRPEELQDFRTTQRRNVRSQDRTKRTKMRGVLYHVKQRKRKRRVK